ncbi:uncharacterized protein HaLaN_11328 [Haematococcus lacustris]|uniref:Uncharacterized protein n=1 Tax=Haematococcus lacustris TaxID=44745 RepID=A0A699YXZ5_HAELA|nr:uncharacterized protein HaLaN_11328 [Haematococcus lacustris]
MSRRGRRGKAADSVDDTTESPQRAIFKLQLRSQDPEFKPSLQIVAGEYATRYLEQLGVDPSKQTLDLVHAHVPLTDKCITTTLRVRMLPPPHACMAEERALLANTWKHDRLNWVCITLCLTSSCEDPQHWNIAAAKTCSLIT